MAEVAEEEQTKDVGIAGLETQNSDEVAIGEDDVGDDSDAAISDEDAASASDDSDDSDEYTDDESVLTVDVDFYDEESLPPYACRYCGIHDPASVARCVDSNKWFCNAVGAGGGGSHLVHHLVRSRSNQVQLHPESPLGDTVLECYNCASKNCFVLGFVPANASSVVVLLCRVCVETVPALKDMDWELSQWHPLVQDRKFLTWLVKVSL